ncbi:MAG: hypothetical protein FJ191_11020 [Gammaproteobacteria bacterium]|nr:hypothetical protein [Gammaproteobacteria bacterium]
MDRWPRPPRLPATLAAALLALAVTSAARAQHDHEHQHEPAHQHQSDAAAVAQMQLDGERKWPTDAPLRAGMAAIRAAFDTDHAAIHAGTETEAQYATLAGTIEAAVNEIIANCRLPPAADANLHYAIADLMAGVARMRDTEPGADRHAGAALVHGALQAYGRFFDDPAAAE